MIGPRHPSVAVPVVGAVAAVQGLFLSAGAAGDFRSLSYTVPFDLAGRPVWGGLFFAVGLAVLVVHHWAPVVALIAAIGAWAGSLAASAVTVDGVPPTAPVAWTGLWLILLLSVPKRGIRPGR